MDYAFTIQPLAYTAFENEAEQIDKCKEWGLLSEKAVRMKAFFYKREGRSVPCEIVGFTDKATAVIQLDNGRLHCIHPSYLKEMQAANYGVKGTAADSAEETATDDGKDAALDTQAPASAPAGTTGAEQDAQPPDAAQAAQSDPASATASEDAAPGQTATEAPAKPAAKGKKAKLELPEGKVGMTATVQEFTTVPNHFSDTDDEVVIYEAVTIADPALELGAAWSSHSATLKKLELAVGDTIAFEAKVAAKKLTKHPVPYKINNPSKIQKV